MAILEIEMRADEQAQLQRDAERVGVSISEWARQRLFGTPPVTFTTDDGEVYEIPYLPADSEKEEITHSAIAFICRC